MRAIIRTGPSKTLTLDSAFPDPTANEFPEKYIIQTKATALTRGELTWPEPLKPEIPICGYDFAGIVVATPQALGTNAYGLGDEVYGLTSFSKQGNARELVVLDGQELTLKPRNVSWVEAAAVPLSALSAFQGLFTKGNLNAPGTGTNNGKRVLVTAASGGVGIWAVQLAHQAGVDVVGTCGPSNIEFVKSLGADTVLDYTKTNLLDWVQEDPHRRSFDMVFDCIGGQTLTDAWKCTKKDGLVISIAEPADSKKPSLGVEQGVHGVWFIVEPSSDQLGKITELIEQGKCKGQIDQVFTLDQYNEAFERLEGGHAKGKVVLKV
ncbi:alcohol dehydrogenase [Phaeosphaeriaceae sp. PMI808]|nr:alcohol dehydrogenase [Phaeosphaeriaceae sp. PMI808]